jgi:integrase
VDFAAYTGLRFGELAALHVRNLDRMYSLAFVEQSATEIHGTGCP